MSKTKEYLKLVEKRKKYNFGEGLRNPSESIFDTNEIEPWANWHNDLNAEIMVIGQEFSDYATFEKTEGEVERFENTYEYPSNKNLAELLKLIGRDPGHPKSPNLEHKLFFTNCVMALKDGSMSSNFRDKWMKPSREEFLAPLIDIVKPKIIVCVGLKSLESVSKIFKFKTGSLKSTITRNPIEVDNTKIFAMYHTGGLGIRNRKYELQKNDWKKIKDWL